MLYLQIIIVNSHLGMNLPNLFLSHIFKTYLTPLWRTQNFQRHSSCDPSRMHIKNICTFFLLLIALFIIFHHKLRPFFHFPFSYSYILWHIHTYNYIHPLVIGKYILSLSINV